MSIRSARHTITVNEYTFKKLRSVGVFGESYSDLISRLVESINSEGGKENEYPNS
jgi:predicted CopG family antitoxin